MTTPDRWRRQIRTIWRRSKAPRRSTARALRQQRSATSRPEAFGRIAAAPRLARTMRPSPAEPTSPDSDRCSPSSRAYAATGVATAVQCVHGPLRLDGPACRHGPAPRAARAAMRRHVAFDRDRALRRRRQPPRRVEPRADRCSNPSRIRPRRRDDGVVFATVELARRVPTLPRRSRNSRSGRSARGAPAAATRGTDARPAAMRRCSQAFDTKASAGSRAGIAGRNEPGSSSIGTSFSECTAQWTRPLQWFDSSSSLRNLLPPIAASERSSTSSPRVLIGTSSTASPGCAARNRAATCSLCHSASGFLRVAMRRMVIEAFMSQGATDGRPDGCSSPSPAAPTQMAV